MTKFSSGSFYFAGECRFVITSLSKTTELLPIFRPRLNIATNIKYFDSQYVIVGYWEDNHIIYDSKNVIRFSLPQIK